MGATTVTHSWMVGHQPYELWFPNKLKNRDPWWISSDWTQPNGKQSILVPMNWCVIGR